MKQLFVIFLIAGLFVLTACPVDIEYPFIDICFRNNSDDSVWVFNHWNVDFQTDTCISMKDTAWVHVISPNNYATISFYENVDNKGFDGNDTIIVFVAKHHKKSVSATIYNIIDSSGFVCIYLLSGVDVELLSDTIPYPPSPEMKDMRMYPPYEEIIKQEE